MHHAGMTSRSEDEGHTKHAEGCAMSKYILGQEVSGQNARMTIVAWMSMMRAQIRTFKRSGLNSSLDLDTLFKGSSSGARSAR
jgi:hypothetical protein